MSSDFLVYGSGFEILFFIIFFMVLSAFGVFFFHKFDQWRRNKQAPRLRVAAGVISKRADRKHIHHGDMDMAIENSKHFATFEMEGGDRMELRLPGAIFALLSEGDHGILTFQGSRFIDFEPHFRFVAA